MLYECGYKPHELYSLLMKDVYLIFHGRALKRRDKEVIARKQVVILAEVFNRTMGGEGVVNAVMSMWPVEGDPKPKLMTREEFREHHKQVMMYHESELARKRGAG